MITTRRLRTCLARRFSFFAAASMLMFLSILISGGVLKAQTFWQGDVGSWFTSSNWSSGVPNSNTEAQINNGGTATILFPGAVANNLYLGRNGFQSGDLDVLGGAAQFRFMGVGFAGFGTLTIKNGGDVIATTNATIGGSSGGNGGATVDGPGSTWTIGPNGLNVGFGLGTLDITNGGAVSADRCNIGLLFEASPGTGTVTVDGAGSSLTTQNQVVVARSGTSFLNVLNGANVTSATATVGDLSGAGAAVVDAATWTNAGTMLIGNNPFTSGVLTVRNGGSVTVGGGLGLMQLALSANSTGTLRIGGGGGPAGTINASEVTGGAGSAFLIFDHTSAAHVFARPITGSINLQHAGSGKTVLTATNTYDGETLVTGGTLEVSGGGRINNARESNVGYFPGQDGSVVVSGAGSKWINSATTIVGRAASGAITVENGGELRANAEINLGRNPEGNGTFIVTGAGSKAMTGGQLRIGDQGVGELRIENGGAVTSGAASLGAGAATARGAATVTGAGSTWTIVPGLTVGGPGHGSLTIEGGGSVSSARTSIASASGSRVTVDGLGSAWSNSGGVVV